MESTTTSPLQFAEALEEIRSGRLSVRSASVKYSIPRTTLHNHRNNPNVKKNGRPTVLTEAEEQVIADLMLTCSEFRIELDQAVFTETLAEAARERGELTSNLGRMDRVCSILPSDKIPRY